MRWRRPSRCSTTPLWEALRLAEALSGPKAARACSEMLRRRRRWWRVLLPSSHPRDRRREVTGSGRPALSVVRGRPPAVVPTVVLLAMSVRVAVVVGARVLGGKGPAQKVLREPDG